MPSALYTLAENFQICLKPSYFYDVYKNNHYQYKWLMCYKFAWTEIHSNSSIELYMQYFCPGSKHYINIKMIFFVAKNVHTVSIKVQLVLFEINVWGTCKSTTTIYSRIASKTMYENRLCMIMFFWFSSLINPMKVLPLAMLHISIEKDSLVNDIL